MNDARARLILGLGSGEIDNSEIREQLEEKVFEQGQFFLQRAFIPKLAHSRISRARELQDAFDTLVPKSNTRSPVFGKVSINPSNSLLDIIAKYNQAESQLKREISNIDSPTPLIELLENWIEIFEIYAKGFVSAFPKEITDLLNPDDVKISERPDVVGIIQEIKDGVFEKSALKEYHRLRKLLG